MQSVILLETPTTLADPWAHKQTLVEDCFKPVQTQTAVPKKKIVKKVKKEKRTNIDDLVPVQEKRGPLEVSCDCPEALY